MTRPPKAWIQNKQQQAALTARSLLSGDHQAVILDTETTAPRPDQARIVSVGIINTRAHGEALLDRIINPGVPIPASATRVHGVTDSEVVNAPTFADIHASIARLINYRIVIIYNADFDAQLLQYEAERHGLEPFKPLGWYCAMKLAAAWRGVWNDRFRSFRWPKLTDLATDLKINTAGAHGAIADCRMTLAILESMAKG